MGYVTKHEETRIVITDCILSYPHLFEPRAAAPGQKPKYSATFILPEDFSQEDWNVLGEVVNFVATQQWPHGIPDPFQLPWRTVNEKTPLYEGRHCISGSSPGDKKAPDVVIENGKTPATVSEVFPGMGVAVYLNAFAYFPSKERPMIKNGIGFGLNGVQITDRERPNLGGVSIEGVFKPVSVQPSMPGLVPTGAPSTTPSATVPVPGTAAAKPPVDFMS